MKVRSLSIAGAWELIPSQFSDDRGYFCEWFKGDLLSELIGHRFDLAQANCSVSRQGVLRGIHFADVPPGQAKYVTCAAGEVLDVAVDVRVGSPTFGRWESVLLTADRRNAVYLAEGLGHAFMALSENAVVMYLCSTGYNPAAEHAVHPLDPAIGIAWPRHIDPILSEKDAAAPALAQAQRAGLLPDVARCPSPD